MLLRHPRHFISRELSWLDFNDRVLEEALDHDTPLLERLKFLCITATNLDEFFMVRLSGVQEQISADVRTRGPEGMTPGEQFALIHQRAHRQSDRLYKCLREEVLPALASEAGLSIVQPARLPKSVRAALREYFMAEVFPVLTPLAVDPGHPFPHLRNRSLNLAVRLEPPGARKESDYLFAIVGVPAVIPRLVPVSAAAGRRRFVLLEDVIADNVDTLFAGLKLRECVPFRVTRDADLEYAEDEAEDLLKTIEAELRERDRGNAVRLEIHHRTSAPILRAITSAVQLNMLQVYSIDGPLNPGDLMRLYTVEENAEFRDPPFTPAQRPPLRDLDGLFATVNREDVLLHHPYEAFAPVVEFIRQAAEDPQVLAIKQTLYRTSGDSPIVKALMRAAENGKQVTALVELKARFDEENNIVWARRLERAGVHVVYGLVGLKTHCKIALVVRREEDGIVRYAHVGTGNYNPTTARVYTDIGLFSTDTDLCDDASELFNLLTGYLRQPHWRRVAVAPLNLRSRLMKLIEQQTALADEGRPARIRAKMNALVDPDIIVALYKASCAGVKIDLNVRGVCCLRPGLKDVSENITVWSVVDRFLEHSRVFIFGEDEAARVFISSADWMPRNLDRRVEIMVPILDQELAHRLIHEIFGFAARDTVKARELRADGSWVPRRHVKGERRFRSQVEFLKLEETLRDKADSALAQEEDDALYTRILHPAIQEAPPPEAPEDATA